MVLSYFNKIVLWNWMHEIYLVDEYKYSKDVFDPSFFLFYFQIFFLHVVVLNHKTLPTFFLRYFFYTTDFAKWNIKSLFPSQSSYDTSFDTEQ